MLDLWDEGVLCFSVFELLLSLLGIQTEFNSEKLVPDKTSEAKNISSTQTRPQKRTIFLWKNAILARCCSTCL